MKKNAPYTEEMMACVIATPMAQPAFLYKTVIYQ
jgi:hypothetical protein